MTINLDPAQLMPVLPAVLGLVVAGLVALVTKATAPAGLKRSVAALLAVLAGVIPTVALTPHEDAKTYVAAILSAWVVAVTAHAAGLTGWVQNRTSSFGVGPAEQTPAGGTQSMGAGAPTEPEPEQGPTPEVQVSPASPADASSPATLH